jgi:hypothetical protein
MHPSQRSRHSSRGAALIALLAVSLVAILAFAATMFGPNAVETYRNRKTEAALTEAREALLGYAAQYRDAIDPNSVYGYLPLPDLGYSTNLASDENRNNNIGCQGEGCDAGSSVRPAGSVLQNFTVIGRFPWRLMGTEPIRDGHGECLWYAVSGSHKRTQPVTPMNWDALGQLDVLVANGASNLASLLVSAHERPVAIIFSAGPRLPGQDRSGAANQVVDACGGNYDAANYLDPGVAGALAGVTNFFGGSTNNASADTSAATKSLSPQGPIYLRSDSTLWPNACTTGDNCTLAANDRGLALTSEALFGAIRKNNNFRFHINSMLDRMTECLRDRIAAGLGFVPQAIAGYVAPADKSAGRIHSDACFNTIPPGYFDHWRDMFFVAQPDPPSGTLNVNGNGTCKGVVVFAGQRSNSQLRTNLAQQSDLANYLEGSNLAGFTAPGSNFSGPTIFDVVSPTQAAAQDIVRCIPDTTSFLTVNSPDLLAQGFGPLASYDPGTRTLTLGSENATTGNGASEAALYGCAWTPEANSRGGGFRTYFTMRFMGITGGVGNNGFVFAALDGENNTTSVCGEAGSHLGYSGSNGVSPPLTFPKIGIEFDQGRDTGAVSNAFNSGRNDPCGTSGCGGTVGYNSHSAIVYWGDRALNYDDNVHGAGVPPPDPTNPSNPAATPPGIAFINYRANEDADSDGLLDSYLYHVRVEVKPVTASVQLANVRVAAAGNVAIATPGAQIDGVDMATGNRVLLAGQTSAADNGIYVWSADDQPLTRTADADTAAELTDAGVTVSAGHHAGDWRQMNTITNIGSDGQSWQPAVRRFQTQAWIVRDSDTTAQIRSAMQDTTTAMATGYPGHSATLSDTATMFASAGGACTTSANCATGQTCGLDNICYRPALKSIRLGFTNSQRTQDQRVIISNFFASWPQ